MSLFTTINQCLSDKLLAQLADASTMPLAVTEEYCALAVAALVRQLAAPTDASELNARWDMCRQLFLSQVLTDADELLRTDIGWPDRRRYLAQKLLGAPQVAALTEATTQPAQAMTLLGYLTVIALAAVGEKASTAELDPTALGAWLSEQSVPTDVVLPPALAASRKQAPATHAASVVSPVARKSRAKVTILSVVGVLALAGIAGGYFLLSTPANATEQEAPAVATTAAAELAVVAAPEPVAPASIAPTAAPTSAAPVVAPAAAAPKAAVPLHAVAAAGPVLRDTVGNAALAKQVGGKFNAALGRYPKGEGQPLLMKLINHATLTVGINSTESLLYKRLVNPSLPRPADIALDRLAFDPGQAKLGAEGAQQLGNVANLLKTFPKARLLVVGHANNKEAQAIHLGLQRATAAVDELVKQGISASRIQAQGVLATELPTENDSAEKQAMLQGISVKLSRL